MTADRILSPLQARLVDGLQRGFPLVARPFEAIAAAEGVTPEAVIESVRDLIGQGVATRLGAVVRPNTAGASTLAALACTPDEVERVGRLVSAEAGVTHNYAREHATLPLWFVVTGANRTAVEATLRRIRVRTRQRVFSFPLEREYRIDLGFGTDPGRRELRCDPARSAFAVLPIDRRILAAIENGLPLVAEPYGALAETLGLRPEAVRGRLARLLLGGVVKRLGLVVRHRTLGFGSNAMVVFDPGDRPVDTLAQRFLPVPSVTLLYARRPAPPVWPYRLYAMIHGRERGEVLAEVDRLVALAGPPLHYEVLFSTTCFKQTGARLSA
ncbi:siroheme decarboxylase subunit beta [Prosthecomicrobium sp. N25]|uniref:siroheme decarboxylase subunit beta n=1 Tax=Prosthecomicrobium sp. N25 TaxID=3129254 RepID=UPI0030771751